MKEKKTNDQLKFKGINNAGFGIIQKSVMQNRKLHGTAKCLYAYFCIFASTGNACTFSAPEFCYDLNFSPKTFSKYLKSLVNYGYVKIEPTYKNGRFPNNTYILYNPKLPNKNKIEG